MGIVVHKRHLYQKVDMSYIIGVDEVGRGSLAGDVYVAGVMVPEEMQRIPGVDDSKKLRPESRQRVFDTLMNTPDLHHIIATRSVEQINEIGIDRCVGECFLEAIQTLVDKGLLTSAAYIDGKPILFMRFKPGIPIEFIIGGDAKNWVIGAASIIAKVTRDRYMVGLAPLFPDYGWEKNMGYGTPIHIEGLRKKGLSPLHRVKFCRKFEVPSEQDVGALVSDLFGSDEK